MQRSLLIRLLIVGIVLFILLFPLVFLGVWSISSSWPWPYLTPQALNLELWLDFFSSGNRAWLALRESFIIGSGVTILAVMISIPAGRALAFYQFPGKEFIKLLVLAPIIVPPLAVTMGIHITFLRYGLSGTIWGVMLVHLIPTIPYSIKILTDTFKVNGRRLEKQAQVLGANLGQRFFYVTFPLIKPGVLAAGIMVFIISFSQYFLTFLMGEGRVITFPMVLFPLVEQGNRSLAAVYSWVFILAILTFTVILELILKDRVKEQLKCLN